MERIVQGRSATLTHTFYTGPTATDPSPDSATVTITRSDGTVLVNNATATEAGVGVVTYTVTPAQTATLDRWTVTWTATFGGQSQTFVTYVEVAGGVLFSIAEARSLKPLDDTVAYPETDLVAMRTTVEDALEQACGRAFVPRYFQETTDGDGMMWVEVSKPLIRKVRSITDTGVAWSAGDISSLYFRRNSRYVISLTKVFLYGLSTVVIAYEHGDDEPPPEIKRAGLLLAKQWLGGKRNPIDNRAITFAPADGGTYSLAVPGRNGSYFGDPDIDAAINRYRLAGDMF